MKRDLELIRNILLAVEMKDTGKGILLDKNALGFRSINTLVFNRHILWMSEAKLIIAEHGSPFTGFSSSVLRLTNDGCEFLDNIRDEKTWRSVLKEIADKAASISMTILVDLAAAVVRRQFGL